MIKKLIKLTVSILILFLLSVTVLASGKMEVRLGEKVTLQRETVEPGSTYKWVVKKGREIISTQAASIFNYTFMEQGEYNVNLTLISPSGDTKNTSVYVLVGDRYPRPTVEGEEGVIPPEEMPLMISYSVLPSPSEDGVIHLIGDTKVLFDIDVVRDDILEYRIDRNIFEDSDGNGTANDDIDNANDDSYLLGGIWETEYKEGEAAKIVAEITLIAKDGEKTKSQVEIVFDEEPSREGDPVALLEVAPAPDPKDQLIHLYDDPSMVAFYSRRSEGKILEFRIDKNIFVDSDGDGNPANDIDNMNDSSFQTGDVWKTEYSKTDDQIIAQLIVVGEEGKGSRVQRGIWFTDKPKPPAITEIKDAIQLTADKDFVLKGDPINFAVEGLTQTLNNYIFEWDFDGDGVMDQEIEANNTVMYIYDFAGIYNPKVAITDKDENTADFTLEIVVKDAIVTTSDFDFEIDGNTVEFTNLSVSALKLADKKLYYTWNFGDTDQSGYESQKDQIGISDPTYTYNKAGNYIVSLMITDADQVIDTKTSEIVIEFDLAPEELTGEIAGEDVITELKEVKEGSSLIVKILKVILYLILIIVVLVVLILLGFLVFLKVQHPDLTFEELIDEIKIKILGMLGVHEMLEKPADAMTDDAMTDDAMTDDAMTNDAMTDDAMTNDQLPTEELPIEGEVMDFDKESAEPVSDKEPPLAEGGEQAETAKESGPTPDWMKETKPAPAEEAPVEEPEPAISDSTVADRQQSANQPPATPAPEPVPEPEPVEPATPAPEPEPEAPVEEEDKSDKNKPPKPPSSGVGKNQAPPLSDQSGPVPDWLKGA